MLVELAVHDLGVIAELRLTLGAGLIAVTGETGAGKTMVVEAISLLLGGRADPGRVRTGAEEAVVEGLVLTDDGEHVLRRVVPRDGRSRAYIDGRLATAGELSELGRNLIDLHGQHAHQSLLHTGAQREALDRFAKIDLGELEGAQATVRELEARIAALGGDDRTRARELDLLRFQLDEIDAAGIVDPDEDQLLEREEDLLGEAAQHREAGAAAVDLLAGESAAALDTIGAAVGQLGERLPFADLVARLRALQAEVSEVSRELRGLVEGIEEDPARLDEVRARRRLLRELCRKYGDDLAAVLAFAEDTRTRLEDLSSHEVRAREAQEQLGVALDGLRVAQEAVRAQRVAAAPRLAAAVMEHLGELAMPQARIEISVPEEGAGDAVQYLLAANSGAEPAPLAKVASGGELARTMLALRLVLSEGPPVLVFDEVDAGIGGSAARAVGRALARLGGTRQVLVVTHLPQVAAYAHHQLTVAKHDDGETTTTQINLVDEHDRVIELSRMLSGGDSDSAREHARELLAEAESLRGVG